MTIVSWSDDFKIGEQQIDREHWGLFALIQDLADKQEQGTSEASITATLEALSDYVDVHFTHEEGLMKEVGYPELAAHRSAHEGLRAHVTLFIADYREAPEHFDHMGFAEFLSSWLTQHILVLDMEFAAFYKKSA